jgi:DNA-binding CsgD family transcriptional regulator
MNPYSTNHELNLEWLSQLMPGVYFWKKDKNSVYTDLNQNCAELFGIRSKRDFTGLTDDDIPCKISEFSGIFRQQDQLVMSTAKPLKILEIHRCANNQLRVMLNTKNPLLDANNSMVGTFAYCMDMTNQFAPLMTQQDQITTGSYILSDNHTSPLLHQFTTALRHPTHSTLTKRESECLYYLARGKTAQEIADMIFISRRTVEKHIENIKYKFNCKTKSQLIALFLND